MSNEMQNHPNGCFKLLVAIKLWMVYPKNKTIMKVSYSQYGE